MKLGRFAPARFARDHWTIFALVAVGVGVYFWFSRVAPTPAIFDESVTIQQASVRAQEKGEVVLAVVTADFCPTCQGYKRSALSDPALAQWVRGNAETVYLEWDRDKERIAELGVRAFPATLALDPQGEVLAMHYGPMSATGVISMLEGARAKAVGSSEAAHAPAAGEHKRPA